MDPNEVINSPPGMSYIDSPQPQPQYHEMQPPHFHQRPGYTNQLTIQTESHFRVADWQRPFDSGVQSLQPSAAQSMMSMPGSSRMSVVSMAGTEELTELQRQKFEKINLSFDAAEPEAASAGIPPLIELTKDEDEKVASRALGFLRNIAKKDADMNFSKPTIHQSEHVIAIVELLQRRENQPSLIRNALGALFHISSRNEGTRLVFYANHQLNGLMVRKLIDFIGHPDSPYLNWAVPLLHTLLSPSKENAKEAVQNVKYACDCRALEALTFRLYHEKSEKLLAIIVQTINILCTKNQEQTRFFFEINGPQKLVEILRNYNYEGLLFGTTKLLNKLTMHAEELVRFNAHYAVANNLSSASPRLVEHSLDVLRNLSHALRSNQPQVLHAVVRLFGASKLSLIQCCMDILQNMCSDCRPNKETLCRDQNTIPYLISILNAHFQMVDLRESAARENVQETVLRLLRSLCIDHLYAADVQNCVMNQWGALLSLLITLRPNLIKSTLQLILRLSKDERHLGVFANAGFKDGSTFAHWTVECLKACCLCPIEKPTVDGIKLVDILHATVNVLDLFCQNVHLRNQIAYELMLPDNRFPPSATGHAFLPVIVLDRTYQDKSEKSIKLPALSIISQCVLCPQVAVRFRNDQGYLNGLRGMARMQDYGPIAEKILKIILEGPGYPPLRCPPPPVNRQFPPQRPSSPMENADIPDDLAHIDPFVNVFCPTTQVSENTPPFSPHQHGHAPLSTHPPPPSIHPPPHQPLPPLSYPPDTYNYHAPSAPYNPGVTYPPPSTDYGPPYSYYDQGDFLRYPPGTG